MTVKVVILRIDYSDELLVYQNGYISRGERGEMTLHHSSLSLSSELAIVVSGSPQALVSHRVCISNIP